MRLNEGLKKIAMENTILETGLITRIIWEIHKTKTGYKLTFKQHEKLVGSKNYNPHLKKVRYFKEYPKNFSVNFFCAKNSTP